MILKNDKKHPPYTIEIMGGKKIVREVFHGLWTVETANEYIIDFKNAVQPLISDKWTKLVIMDHFTMSLDDEVIDAFKETLDWARTNNLKFCAHVIADKAKRTQHQDELLFLGTYGFTELFKSENEALLWLGFKGF